MVRVLLSIVFAALLFAVVRGMLSPPGATPNDAMWDVAMIGFAALAYSSLNSFNALRHSLGQSSRLVYVSFLFSFLPLLVVVYSIAVWQYSPTKLTTFQIISMLFGGIASIIDLSLFSWLTFGTVRRSVPDTSSHAKARA